MKLVKISQSDFNQYYSGEIPEYAPNLIGTPNVDVSKIASFFSKVSESVKLVNQFDPSLLTNISVIFNSSDSGSYGVYVPSLDRAIKTKALGKLLEQKGYKIDEQDGMLVANPVKEEKSKEEIQKDIDSLYTPLKSKGGTIFGINMSKDISAAKQNAQQLNSPYPNLWELLAILEIGSTMAHEAAHTKGGDESAAQSVEKNFVQFSLPKINEEYRKILTNMHKEDQFQPLIVKAKSRLDWYKTAQSLNYYPPNFIAPKDNSVSLYNQKAGLPDWGMRNRSPLNDPIETKLGRQFMSKLPKGLSQENDSIELQLRKMTNSDPKSNPKIIYEELLERDRVDPSTSYKSTEELLEETRPTPLIRPIKTKKANNSNKIIKLADDNRCLFGWYNNFSISDGNTIPGLGDRVMAWDDAEEDFAGAEEDIRAQPRYNPEYLSDNGSSEIGAFFKWIEPHFAPELFDSITRDYSNISPARRFASNTDLTTIVRILQHAKTSLLEMEINVTRFVVTENIAKLICKYMNDEKLQTDIFGLKNNLYAIWSSNENINHDDIEEVEKAIQSRNTKEIKEKLHEMFGTKTNEVNKIIYVAEDICKEYELKDINIVGTYAREKLLGNENPDVMEINFNCNNSLLGIKFGNLLAEKLGVENKTFNQDKKMLSFYYKDIKVDFWCGFIPDKIIKLMTKNNINTKDNLTIDICNRDFTINMGAYNVFSKVLHFPFKKSVPEIGLIETLFNPEELISINPMLILRAIKLKAQYEFDISPELETAMIKNSINLLKKCNRNLLISAREQIKDNGLELSKKLFEEYGLSEIENI